MVGHGVVILEKENGKWKYSILPAFAAYLKEFIGSITPEAIEFQREEYNKKISSEQIIQKQKFPKNDFLVNLDSNPSFPIHILAFSDYRIHKFGPLLKAIKESKVKPDLILYAGDDVTRFGPTPIEALQQSMSQSEELTVAWIRGSYGYSSSPSYGYMLRLPKKFDLSEAKDRFSSMIRLLRKLQQVVNTENSEYFVTNLKACAEPDFKVRVSYDPPVWDDSRQRVALIDPKLNSVIAEFSSFGDKGFWSDSAYWRIANDDDLDEMEITLRLVETNGDYSRFHVSLSETESNIFQEIANQSKYGIGVVIGNDDFSGARSWIRGNHVYDLQLQNLRLGSFSVFGMEGAIFRDGVNDIGLTLYPEDEAKSYLSTVSEKLPHGGKLILVSHTPPKGSLDRAIRFGRESIGSQSLRDFLESEKRLKLVLCGHVHNLGGKAERLDNATVMNVELTRRSFQPS